MEEKLDILLEQSNKKYWENFDGRTYFDRAIFLSWYCSIGDCKFCFMSTQKDQIKNPKLAKRQINSLYAEALICKHMNWKVGFLSGGYGVYDYEKIVEIIKNVYQITGQKQWLNIGVVPKDVLTKLKPYVEGVTGSIETVNPSVHEKVCPSKPIDPIIKMYSDVDTLGLKKGMTLIIGLGESIEDFPLLEKFIKEHKIDKIVIYALNPIKGTEFKRGPEKEYYLTWLAKTRISFPKLEIVAGSWTSRLDYLSLMKSPGANSFTKLPVWKVIGTEKAKTISKEMEIAERVLMSDFENVLDIDWEKEIETIDISQSDRKEVLDQIKLYLSKKYEE
jgi:biotin synthase-like enzyme